MPATLALRNIIRDKKNSFIVAALISVITFLFFIGNTIIAQSERGLRKSYTEAVTGDVLVEKKGEVTMSIFGANAPHLEDYFLIEPLPAYNEIITVIKKTAGIESWTSQVSTGARLEVLGQGNNVYLSGIEPESYFNIMRGISVVRGDVLDGRKNGIMITSGLAGEIESRSGRTLEPGCDIMLTTASKSGFKIRVVPLAGIFEYSENTSLPNQIALCDAQTARELAAIRVSNSGPVSDETKVLLGEDVFENMFSDSEADSVIEDRGSFHDGINEYLESKETSSMPDAGGDWNFIILRLKDGVKSSAVIEAINRECSGFGVVAVPWRTAAGVTAMLVFFLQTMYNLGVLIICFAGIIAIVNILLIAVFKRTREIGTLRAIGAHDNYIRKLLIIENFFLGAAGGVTGIILGCLFLGVINKMNIMIENPLVVQLLGVKNLHISIFPEYAAVSAMFSVMLTLVSLVFPIETAVRIEPVVAMKEG